MRSCRYKDRQSLPAICRGEQSLLAPGSKQDLNFRDPSIALADSIVPIPFL